MRQTQTEQSETQHIFPNGGRRLTHDAPTTAADRPPSSKSQPKSSSKRIRSSIYTLTTGSFPEQGAKQINDKRYSELTTHRCLRDLWENTRRDIVKENTANEPVTFVNHCTLLASSNIIELNIVFRRVLFGDCNPLLDIREETGNDRTETRKDMQRISQSRFLF